MKYILISFVALLMMSFVYVTVVEKQSINTTTDSTFTSQTIDISSYETVRLTTKFFGVDSLTAYISYEYNILGTWIEMAKDTILTDVEPYKTITLSRTNTNGFPYVRSKVTVLPYQSADSLDDDMYFKTIFIGD